MTAAAAGLVLLVLLQLQQAQCVTAGSGQLHRAKPQAAAAGVPACFWLEQDKACVPSYQNMLAVPSANTPTNVFRRAYMMSLDRSDFCSQRYTAEAPCMADTASRCFWRQIDSTKGICLNADYAEIIAFEKSGFSVDLATIPSSMTCPGSKAAQFFKCYAHPAPDLCSKLQGCSPAPAATIGGKPVCLPKWAASLDKNAATTLANQIKSLDPAIFGSCEALCWLKQARTCTASGSSQATCEKNAFCAYNVQAKGCAHAQVACPGEDAYDDKMAALMIGCAEAIQKAACTNKTIKLEQAGKWRSWQTPAAAAKC